MLGLLAAAGLLLVVPGWGIYRLLVGRTAGWAMWPPGVLACGLALLFPFLALWSGTLYASLGLALVVAALACVAGAVWPERGPAALRVPRAVVILALVGAAAALWLGAAEDGDSFLHLAIVQRTLDEGQSHRTDAFYRGGEGDVRYSYTLWHPLLASLTILGSVEATTVWALLPLLVVPLYILSVASLGAVVTRSGTSGLLAGFAALLFHLGTQRGRLLPLAGNPGHVACLVLLPTALVLALLFISRGGKLLIAAGLATLSVALVHPFHALLELLAFGGLCVPFFLSRGVERKRACAALLVVTAVILPVALCRLSYRMENPFWLERGSHWQLAGGLWAPSPDRFLPRRPSYLWLVYGLGLVYLVHPSSTKTMRGTALAVALPLIAGLNPLTAPWLAARVSPQMLPRLDHLTFYVLGFVLIGAALGTLWRLTGRSWRRVIRVVLVCLLLVGLWQCWPRVRETHGRKQSREARRGFKALAAEFEPLRRWVVPGEIVISDHATSFALPTFLPVWVVAVPPGSASPADAEQDQRTRDVSVFLDPATSSDTRARLLEKYTATAALIDTTLNPRIGRALMDRASGLKRVASSGRFSLFRRVPEGAVAPPAPFRDEPNGMRTWGPGTRWSTEQSGRLRTAEGKR